MRPRAHPCVQTWRDRPLRCEARGLLAFDVAFDEVVAHEITIDGLLAVARLRDHLDAVRERGEALPHARAKQGMVIDDQHPGARGGCGLTCGMRVAHDLILRAAAGGREAFGFTRRRPAMALLIQQKLPLIYLLVELLGWNIWLLEDMTFGW